LCWFHLNISYFHFILFFPSLTKCFKIWISLS
jgi:hypothetical protein